MIRNLVDYINFADNANFSTKLLDKAISQIIINLSIIIWQIIGKKGDKTHILASKNMGLNVSGSFKPLDPQDEPVTQTSRTTKTSRGGWG